MVRFSRAMQDVNSVFNMTADKDGSLEAPLYPVEADGLSGIASLLANTISLIGSSLEVLRATPAAGAVNYCKTIASATGAAVQFGAGGTDTDIDIGLTPKGAGRIVMPNGSTGAGTPQFGSNCPANTLTAPVTWIEVKISGVIVYVPAWR